MNRAELEQLSDEDLLTLEDELLFENETTIDWSVRAAAGRLVNFFLMGILWLVIFMVFLEPIKKASGAASPLVQFIWVFVSGVLGAIGSMLLWKVIGMRGRQFIRGALHYWPVTITMIIWIYSFTRQS